MEMIEEHPPDRRPSWEKLADVTLSLKEREKAFQAAVRYGAKSDSGKFLDIPDKELFEFLRQQYGAEGTPLTYNDFFAYGERGERGDLFHHLKFTQFGQEGPGEGVEFSTTINLADGYVVGYGAFVPSLSHLKGLRRR